jgi:hypothetical protein
MGQYTPARFDDPELHRISQALSSPNDALLLSELHREPARIKGGTVVFADGSDWNPGSGAGLYLRNAANSAWEFVAGAILSLANTWTQKQTFSNYTVLGAGPAIKTKKITGTTAATQGAAVGVAHGLTLAKILSVSVFVNIVGRSVPPGFVGIAGEEYSTATGTLNVNLYNSAANSINILSQPFTALIIYEE